MTELRGKKYSGDLFARQYGSTEAFRKIGNVVTLSMTKDSETDDLLSSGRDDFGAAIETESKPGPTKVDIAFNTFNKHNFGMILMGEVTELSTNPVTAIDEAAVAVFDGWHRLAHKDINPATVVLQTTGGTPATIDAEHIILNHQAGTFALRESAKTAYSLTAGDALSISYDTAGTAGIEVDINTLDRYDLEMYLDGKDRITQQHGVLDLYHAVLKGKDGLNWLSDEWWQAGVDGTLIKPDDKKAVGKFTEYAA